ncbi:hypothetical protein C7B69_17110 [filamentous cyanobacterium Phorm 46]|nr:hypothetical protein C7B69_17110 [filamentous cyanobacterium Phorm 46]PSB42677.1 hypothetical protein C7B67_24915 [filamentous cyanobacterium Phorm 6]
MDFFAKKKRNILNYYFQYFSFFLLWGEVISFPVALRHDKRGGGECRLLISATNNSDVTGFDIRKKIKVKRD